MTDSRDTLRVILFEDERGGLTVQERSRNHLSNILQRIGNRRTKAAMLAEMVDLLAEELDRHQRLERDKPCPTCGRMLFRKVVQNGAS